VLEPPHPALSLIVTKGSSMAAVVLTLTAGPPEPLSSDTNTAERGNGVSPVDTSAARHSGGDSDASSRKGTLKSSGMPSTAVDCALPKPQAFASPNSIIRAAADRLNSGYSFKNGSTRELGISDVGKPREL
jgi:hypothetical protein